MDVRLYTLSPASVSAEKLKSLLSSRERRTVLKLLGTRSTIVHLTLWVKLPVLSKWTKCLFLRL